MASRLPSSTAWMISLRISPLPGTTRKPSFS